MITPFSAVFAFGYQNVVKKVFFKIDAETVHNFMVASGETMGMVPFAPNILRTLFRFDSPYLSQTIKQINFTNPVGLAAGFDYNGQLTQILASMGFGFQTVGTITAEPYAGNPKPRLGRLPKSKSLLVNKGYKNPGVNVVVQKLQNKQFQIPVGFSVGSTNKEFSSSKEQIQDFITTFKRAEQHLPQITHYELNISCPNLKTGEPFTTPDRLKPLLIEVEKLKLSKPVFIKMPTDLSLTESKKLLQVAEKYKSITGCIFGNLTKDRKNPDLVPEEVALAGKGNFSGKPVEKRANALLADAYKHFGKRFILIGCGGIFSAEDAYKKIRLGASLVQMITGMIYMGPQVIGQINHDLVKLLMNDGYTHISEAIGVDVK